MDQLSENAREQLVMRATECWDDRSSIREKIELARYLHSTWGDALQRDPVIHDLLSRIVTSSMGVVMSLWFLPKSILKEYWSTKDFRFQIADFRLKLHRFPDREALGP